MSFSERLKELRKEKELNQSDLADMLNVYRLIAQHLANELIGKKEKGAD